MVDAVRLDVAVEKGAVGGPRFKTTILDGYAGKEQRNVDWRDRRGEWTIGYGIRPLADLSISTIFHACMGRAYAFRFKDWADFTTGVTFQTLAAWVDPTTGVASTTKFQVSKTYNSGVRSYVRPILCPIEATLVVNVGGVLNTSWTLLSGGVLDFGGAPGGAVTATYDFDVPVRFDTDYLPLTVDIYGHAKVTAIKLVEVNEP